MYESWKPIPGYKGIYEISNYGRVKSVNRWIKQSGCWKYKAHKRLKIGKELKQKTNKYGYQCVVLCRGPEDHKHSTVHRLVLLAFAGRSKKQVNHKDGNKKNNKLENLEYCTAKENTNHAIKSGLKKGKLTDKERRYIKSSKGVYSAIELGRMFGVSRNTIYEYWD